MQVEWRAGQAGIGHPMAGIVYYRRQDVLCVSGPKNEEVINKHAELSGFPATKVTEVGTVIDPTTAA